MGEIAQHFGAVGIPAVVLDEKRGQDGKGVSVVTYHRAKGLEARAVAVVGAGTHFWPGDGYRDQRTSSDNEDEVRRRGRAPLFVACTRARERLLVSWVGSPSPLLTRSLASLDPR